MSILEVDTLTIQRAVKAGGKLFWKGLTKDDDMVDSLADLLSSTVKNACCILLLCVFV